MKYRLKMKKYTYKNFTLGFLLLTLVLFSTKVNGQSDTLNIVTKERNINVYFDCSNNFYAKYQGISFYGLSYRFSGKWNNQHEVVYNLFTFKKEEVALYQNSASNILFHEQN